MIAWSYYRLWLWLCLCLCLCLCLWLCLWLWLWVWLCLSRILSLSLTLTASAGSGSLCPCLCPGSPTNYRLWMRGLSYISFCVMILWSLMLWLTDKFSCIFVHLILGFSKIDYFASSAANEWMMDRLAWRVAAFIVRQPTLIRHRSTTESLFSRATCYLCVRWRPLHTSFTLQGGRPKNTARKLVSTQQHRSSVAISFENQCHFIFRLHKLNYRTHFWHQKNHMQINCYFYTPVIFLFWCLIQLK